MYSPKTKEFKLFKEVNQQIHPESNRIEDQNSNQIKSEVYGGMLSKPIEEGDYLIHKIHLLSLQTAT